MLPTPAHTDLSRTCRYCHSSWSVWRPLISCHYCSLDFERAIRLKPLFCGCCLTSSKLSTVVTQPPWSFWTCLRPLTTLFFCSACRRASVSARTLTAGFSHTFWSQGSVLGPILFVLYTADLITLIESYGLSPHVYADDTQVYVSCPPAAADSLSLRVSECADAISTHATDCNSIRI